MKRRPFRYPLWVERLEDRDAPNSLLAIDDVLNGPLPSEAAAPPPRQHLLAGR